MNGAELLVSALENEGVTQIFGLPGEENLAMVEALRRSSIKLVVARHEQAAAFMAATHGRLTGTPGVCLTTLGPGALNLTTGAAYAPRRHADRHDHGPEERPQPQAGALSGGGHRLDHDAAYQDGPPDRQPCDNSRLGAGSVQGGAAGAAWTGASRTARGHRGRAGARYTPDLAAPDRGAGRSTCGARSGGGADPGSRAAADHAGCGGEPAAPLGRLVRFRAAPANSVLQCADGKGFCLRRVRALHGHRRALGARLCP